MPHRVSFFLVGCGIADEPLVKNDLFLFINTFWGEDACPAKVLWRGKTKPNPLKN